MNYIYKRMLNELDSNQTVLDKEQMSKFETYVSNKYQDFYANKVTYEVLKQGEEFLITLMDNPSITLEEILREIKE